MKSLPVSRLRPAAAALVTAAVLATAPSAQAQTYRSVDGTSNNPFHPDWGSAGIPLERQTTMDYSDGVEAMAGATRPSARLVSNLVCAQSGSRPAADDVTDFVWQWGQFVDHDIDLTGGATPDEPVPIPVPTGDPFFDPLSTGAAVIDFSRSVHTSNPTLQSPRQQMNQITAFLDGSNVYGSDPVRALTLRRLDGSGKLLTSPGDLLPFNVYGLPNAPTANDPTLFLAGDVRCNEQVGLTALHTLFMREHNSLCDRIHALHPAFDDEMIYQTARAIVGAEIEIITYREWLPLLLGPGAIPPYTGWNPGVNPGIENAFSTACFRFGHTMLSPFLQRLDAQRELHPRGRCRCGTRSSTPPSSSAGGGIEPLLRGLATQRPQEVDVELVDDVRNFLFGPPGRGRLRPRLAEHPARARPRTGQLQPAPRGLRARRRP